MIRKSAIEQNKYYYVLENIEETLKWKILDFCYNDATMCFSLLTNEIKVYNEELYFVSPKLEPGQYYERISRPTFSADYLKYIFVNNQINLSYKFQASYKDINKSADGRESYRDFFRFTTYNIDLKRRVNLLIHKFYNICDFIEPNDKNDKSYGLVIRELLILICTEIESVFKNILIENNIAPISKNFTTKDYVRLLPILKLTDYSIVQYQFSNCKFDNPFINWKSNNPSKSLIFYDAYNKIKHNSEGELEKANMLNLKNSLVALVILSSIQIGDLVCDDFFIIGKPKFEIEEWYIDGKLNFNKEDIRGEGWRKGILVL